MAEHGGYRKPSDPAPVSGPGALSQRTDGGATQAPQVASGGEYGSRKESLDLQAGAAMAGGGTGAPMPTPSITRDMLTPLDAPSARPDENVRAGAGTIRAVGASEIDDATRERLLSALPTLAWLASQPKASEQTRQFFRQMRGDL